MTRRATSVELATGALDLLMPLHIVFDGAGRVERIGPLVEKLTGPTASKHLEELLTIRRPDRTWTAKSLLASPGQRLMVELRRQQVDGEAGASSGQRLLATVVPLVDGRGLLQMAFGTDLAHAVEAHNLTLADFSPVDNVMDILYLLEAQGLVRGEMEALTQRMDKARRSAEREAETDRLTGAGNRRAMDRAMRALFDHAAETGFGVMHLDLDKFKSINDTMGHAAGDAVLIEVATILREETRKTDHVCRIGGDEFVILFPDCNDPDFLAGIAERILKRLKAPVRLPRNAVEVSVSIGIAMSKDYAELDMDRILLDADSALYQSKDAGRGCYHFHGTSGDVARIGP